MLRGETCRYHQYHILDVYRILCSGKCLQKFEAHICCLRRSKQRIEKEEYIELPQKKAPSKRAKDAKAIKEEEDEKVDVGAVEQDTPVRKSTRVRRPAIKEVCCSMPQVCCLHELPNTILTAGQR